MTVGRNPDRGLPAFDPAPWMADAACRDMDPEFFFPARGTLTGPIKAVCAGCEVRDECLQYALNLNLRSGIYGGRSERERRTLRARLRAERRAGAA